MSPDKSDIEAHGLNASSCLHPTASFLHFLPPWPPTLLQSFPSCPEVIFVWILAELHCLMTAQSWDFMMQSMSKIGKEQKRSFSKCSRFRRGSYMWEICHHSRGLIMIPAHRERKRAPRYEGSNWAGSVSDSMKRGICLLWNPVGVCELHITYDLWLGRLFFFFFCQLGKVQVHVTKEIGRKTSTKQEKHLLVSWIQVVVWFVRIWTWQRLHCLPWGYTVIFFLRKNVSFYITHCWRLGGSLLYQFSFITSFCRQPVEI